MVLTTIINLTTGWQASTSPLTALAALLFSVFLGLAAGYYPARRTSQLNPIEALRSE